MWIFHGDWVFPWAVSQHQLWQSATCSEPRDPSHVGTSCQVPQSFQTAMSWSWALVKPWRRVMGHSFRGTINMTMCSRRTKPAFEWCYVKEHGSNNSEKEKSFRELMRQALWRFITQETERPFIRRKNKVQRICETLVTLLRGYVL